MKIAHISDLHICVRNKPYNVKRTEKLLQLTAENDVDHVIISGDISQNSSVEDFEILRELLIKYNLLSSNKTSLVIGNHDIYGGVHLAEDIITFPTKCANIKFENRVNRFVYFFNETFENTIKISKQSHFPYLKVFDKFILIGLNSNMEYSKIKNIAASNGKIDLKEYSFLNNVLEQKEFIKKRKFLVLHHHVSENINKFNNKIWHMFEKNTMKLRGKRKFLNFLTDNKIDLVLHGHVHQNYKYENNGIHFLNGGASTENDLDNDMRINFINLLNNEIRITINSVLDVEPVQDIIEPIYPFIPSFA